MNSMQPPTFAPLFSPTDGDPLTFIVECVKAFLTSDDTWLSSHPLRTVADWPTVISLTEHHRVLPLVYKALVKANSLHNCTEQERQLLTHRYRQGIRHRFQLVDQTLRLLKQFDQAGIRVLPLKGALLSLQLYGDITLRSSCDIDLLIEPGTYPQVKALLRDMGYHYQCQACEQWNEQQENFFLHSVSEVSWIHTKSHVLLDLHFRWFQNPELFKLSFDKAYESAAVLQVERQGEFRVLPLEYQMLYLSAHGAKSAWHRLLWLTDIAALSLRKPDWDQLFIQAQQMNLLRPLGQAISLNHVLFRMNIPTQWADLCNTFPLPYLVSEAMVAIVARESLSLLPPFRKVKLFYYRFLLQELSVLNLKAVPLVSILDYQLLPLPTFLLPLYIVLRPAFYLIRWLQYRYF